jgi:hypothetical protein
MSTSMKSPRFGRRGAGFSLTVAVLVFSLIGLSTMVGCKKHNDPVSADQSGVLCRSGQAFSTPEEWGDAGTVDSSTSTWTVGGGTIGDIATEDDGVDPLVTAFVKSKAIMGGVVISLMLRNSDWVSVYEGDFGYQGDNCQHPAVEVTYTHEDQSDPELTAHMIWSQQFSGQWDIVYAQLQFDPTDEPPWEPTFYDSGLVTDTALCYETQPDLAVYYPDGDLYAVCTAEVPGPTRYAIYAYKLPYDDGWDPDGWVSAGPVALLNTTPKEHPSIDAGLSSRIPDGEPMELVQVVWSQPVNGEYNIFYNYWEIVNYAHPPYNIRISPEMDNTHQILPKIEVLPNSSGLNEAVIAWGCECAGQGSVCYPEHIFMVVTPFIGSEYSYTVYDSDLVLQTTSRCPDIAPCQGDYDLVGRGLIALSRHHRGEGTQAMDIRASTYTVYVDYQGGTFQFEDKQGANVGCDEPEWDPYWPFAGPTICLRIPDPSDWRYNDFGMGWIDDSETAYLAQGDTTE